MAGTKEGGRKAAETNLTNDPNFYKRIGSIGGKNGRTGGFYRDSDRAREEGAKGGRIGKNGYRLVGYTEDGEPMYVKRSKK